MPLPAGGKSQQTMDSYGKNGVNRTKYQRKNPRDGPILNSQPIEVNNRYKFDFLNVILLCLGVFFFLQILGREFSIFLLTDPTYPWCFRWLRCHGMNCGGWIGVTD